MIFGNKQYTIQAQDKQVIFDVKVSWLFRIIWLDALILEVHSSTLLRQEAWLYKEYSLKKEDREGLQIEKWGICLGIWRLLGDHLIYKKMMATKNAISFNGNELLIKKKNCCGRKVYEEANGKQGPSDQPSLYSGELISQRTPQS